MKTIIIGAGLSGLAAGYTLTKNGQEVIIFEKENKVGGLARTENFDRLKFDLGSHRFWTKNKEIEDLVKCLLEKELINVKRISRIYFQKNFYNYPLKFFNLLQKMGKLEIIKAGFSYLVVKIKRIFSKKPIISFENWVINHFGEEIYKLFFKEYTEKVWGIPCNKLSADWASQRIKGVSFEAVVKSFFKKKNKPKSFIDAFIYPKFGIGRIAEKLKEEIEKSQKGKIILKAELTKIFQKDEKIVSVEINNKEIYQASNFISSMPINELIQKLNPFPPIEIIEKAGELKFRDLIIIVLKTKKKKYTEDTWLYIPDKDISFGRMAQWFNWSPYLLDGQSGLITLEIFSSVGDNYWKMPDQDLINLVKKELEEKIGLIKNDEILDGKVIRLKDAYPLYEIGYQKSLQLVKNYLKQYKNLQLIGRPGLFKYNNMDHALEIGIKAAKNLLGENYDLELIGEEKEYLEES